MGTVRISRLGCFRYGQQKRGYARSPPPVFLQDLSTGTFSNVEQQDLHFVKHTLRRWIEQAEQEMNLKLFGRESDLSVRFNVDSLLRGDLKTRMKAECPPYIRCEWRIMQV